MSPSFHVFARELVRRKVRKALAIYLGAALVAMGIANLLEARYATPQIWFDRFLILLFFGLILTGAVAWFWGKAGLQELRDIIMNRRLHSSCQAHGVHHNRGIA